MTLLDTPLSVGSKIALENLAKALAIRERLEPLGMNPEVRLRKNGNTAVLQLNLRGNRDIPEYIRLLCKTLSTRFDKKETSCGFLCFEANVEGIVVKVNSSDCFYGGKPEVVVSKPRTQAYCKKQTEVPRFVKEK